MKEILLITFFNLTILSYLIAQNLIPNPSFEDVNTCQKYNEPCSPKAWRSTTLKSFKYTEYLGSFSFENKQPFDGQRYISLRMFNTHRDFDRTFIQVPLLCPLVVGERYELSMYIYSDLYWPSEIGVYFSDSLFLFKDNSTMDLIKPQTHFSMSDTILKGEWVYLKTTYTATGKEDGLIIGNFKTDELTILKSDRKHKKKDETRRVYISIDQVSLTPIDSNYSTNCKWIENQSYIYKDSIRHIPNQKILSLKTKIPKFNSFDSIIIDTPAIQSIKNIDFIKNDISENSTFILQNINFENNSAVLLSTSFKSLDKLVHHLLSKLSLTIQITGHTDNIGKEIDNLLLSQSRAESVAQYLMQNGISPNRIESFGKGESESIETNNTIKGRQKNRRVEFQLF